MTELRRYGEDWTKWNVRTKPVGRACCLVDGFHRWLREFLMENQLQYALKLCDCTKRQLKGWAATVVGGRSRVWATGANCFRMREET